jgi:hypothetical protein
MLLRRAITRFYDPRRGEFPESEFTFSEFKSLVYCVANSLGLTASKLSESEKLGIGYYSPNFYSAYLDDQQSLVVVLGHKTYRIIAFANPPVLYRGELEFIDSPAIANEIKCYFPDIVIVSMSELTRLVDESDLVLLDEPEIKEIKDQSKFLSRRLRIGEIVFNCSW